MASELRTVTRAEVAEHRTKQSLWMIMEDKVYDVTAFLDEVSLSSKHHR